MPLIRPHADGLSRTVPRRWASRADGGGIDPEGAS